MNTKTIVLTKRAYDWHACMSDNSGQWGAGKTPDEAIGSLVRSWRELFNVDIKWET